MTNLATLARVCAWPATTVAALVITVMAIAMPPVVLITTPSPWGGTRH